MTHTSSLDCMYLTPPTADVPHLPDAFVRLTAAEPAMLPRSSGFYREMLDRGLLVVGLQRVSRDLVGWTYLTPLSSRWAEIGGVQVAPAYRGHGVSNQLVQAAQQLGHTRGYHTLLTAKPSIPVNRPMVIAAARHGLLPVPSSALAATDAEAQRECCCCDDAMGSLRCAVRDRVCVTCVELATPELARAARQHLISGALAAAIPDETILARVQAHAETWLDHTRASPDSSTHTISAR